MAEEIEALWQAVEQSRSDKWGPYERYKTLNNVFNGHSSPDEGRRVFDWIMAQCQGPPIGPNDLESQSLEFRAGMQYVAHIIGTAMTRTGVVEKFGTPEEEKHGQRS